MDDVERLALLGVFRLDGPATLDLLLGRQRLVVVDLVHRVRDVRDDEQHRILRRQRLDALLREVDRVATLVEDEVEVLFEGSHLLVPRGELAVNEVVELDALHQLFHAGLLQQLHQLLVLRHAELRLVEQQRAVVGGFLVGDQGLRPGDEVVHHPRLLSYELHDLRVVGRVFLVRLRSDRARNDERRTRLVHQDRIHLVDDRVEVAPLDPLVE